MTRVKPRLSVVVPCYNEEPCIDELHRRLMAVCHETCGDDYEIVLVNDGSSDQTWGRIETFAAESDRIVGVNLARNFGHQLALTAGLTICAGERILILDADLQDPPELLPKMMARMDAGADVVYGQRDNREGETWFKKKTAEAFYQLMQRLTDVHIPVNTGDFRLMSRRALDVLLAMPENYRFIRGMVSWVGMNQEALTYSREERFAGRTKYPVAKMALFALDAITSFSIRPLRIASLLGLFMGVAGIGLLLYTLYSWLILDAVNGWTSLMTVLVVVGSVQLFVLGLMGEYLGRLYIESKRRPLFVIQDIVGASPGD